MGLEEGRRCSGYVLDILFKNPHLTPNPSKCLTIDNQESVTSKNQPCISSDIWYDDDTVNVWLL